ncbi:MAG: DUF1631 domain-containing protein [Cellvibrio sp.]
MTDVVNSSTSNVVSINKAVKPNDVNPSVYLARMAAPLHGIREKTRLYLQKLFSEFFTKVDDSLFDLAEKALSNHDQNIYFDSMREIRLQRRGLEAGYFNYIDQAFAKILVAEARSEKSYIVEELSVVQNDELESLVASDAMIHRANEVYADLLEPLAARIGHLVPVKVYQKNNPVGADVICDAFMAATKSIEIDIKAKLVLYKLFDVHVMKSLGPLYQELNQVMVSHKVLPHYQYDKNSNSAARNMDKQQSNAEPETDEQLVANERDLLVALRGFLKKSADSNRASSELYLSQNALVETLTSLQKHLSGSSTMMTAAQLKTELLQHISHNASAAKVDRSDEEIINLVGMMFEFILDDKNLAVSMKALLAKLQIPFVKLAIIDATFFNKSGHPARKLLNEMSSACLGWQEPPQEKLNRDMLYVKLNSIVNRIAGDFEGNIELFDEMLTQLRVFIEKEERRARILEQRIIDAENGKARIAQTRNQVASVIEKIGDRYSLPSGQQELFQRWFSNLLFLVLVRSGVAGEQWKTVTSELLKLAKLLTMPIASAEHKKLIVKSIPSLLSNIKTQFDEFTLDAFEVTNIIKSIESELISRVSSVKFENVNVKAVSENSRLNNAVKVETSGVDSKLNKVQPIAEPVESAEEVSQSSIVEAPGQKNNEVESSAPVVSDLKSTTEVEAPKVEPNIAMDQHLALVNNLSMGTWFEVAGENDTTYRCRLAAVIKSIGKYIFVNRAGTKVAEETKESLALGLAQGRYTILDDGMLFDRALESVITNLRDRRPTL